MSQIHIDKIIKLREELNLISDQIRIVEEAWIKEHAPYKIDQKIDVPFVVYSDNTWLKGEKATVVRINPEYSSTGDFWYWNIILEKGKQFYSFKEEI